MMDDMKRVPVAYASLVAGYVRITGKHEVQIVLSEVGGPAGVRDYLGTKQPEGEEPAETFGQRVGRCNELTTYALLFGSAPEGSLLVHGTMQGPFEGNVRMRHAWLLIKGDTDMIWEPAQAVWYIKEEWYEYASAHVERAYTYRAALHETIKHKNYGPWHPSEYP